MSPPVQPQLPQTVGDWTAVLHRAATVPVGHADYDDAQQVKQYAVAQIGHLNRLANFADVNAEPTPPKWYEPATFAALHGASLGIGEPLAGVASAATGGSFREGAARYREGLSTLEAAQPTVSAAGEVGGMAALPAGEVGGAVSGLKAGVPLTIAQVGARLARGAVGTGVPGAVAGFSAGGEDPGDLSARLDAAKRAGLVGAALGTAGTGAGLKIARTHLEGVADLTNKGTMRALEEQRLRNAQGVGLRMSGPAPTAPPNLQDLGDVRGGMQPDVLPLHPDARQAIADFNAGKISGEDLRTALDVAAGRTPAASPVPPVAPTVPDATATAPAAPPVPPAAVAPQGAVSPPRVTEPLPIPGSPKGISAIGPPTPPPPSAPTVTDIQGGMAALGRGKTLPYYPRGGAAEQALPPPPAESPPPSFEGGGFEGVTRAMQEPAYQHADVLARQAVHFGLGPFAGLSDAAATQLLQRMIVETVRQGKPIPPITTVPKFLERLVS